MIRTETISPSAPPDAAEQDAIFILPRGELIDPARIRARMAEDLNDLRREMGGADKGDLIELGWTRAQMARHLDAARDIAATSYNDTRAATDAMRARLTRDACQYREPPRATAPAHMAASAFAAAAMVACVYALCLARGVA